MEQALRNECGYKGAVPYWDWSKTAKEGFKVAAITDGSPTSLSGNGAPVAHAQGENIVFNAGTNFEIRTYSPLLPEHMSDNEGNARHDTDPKPQDSLKAKAAAAS